jgi:hypothetical protein
MPKGVDWMIFIYVNLGFIAQVFVMYYFSALADIKANWPLYRCNPLYMPLSDDMSKDFTYCVQNMQTNYMGYLLQPINYIINNLSNISSEFTTSFEYIRTMLSSIRSFVTSITQNIFGVFLNLIIEFQKITISIKDLVGKIIGTMVTLIYLMDGSVKLGSATWNGPPGQMVRGLCFLPDTKIILRDGTHKNMKDLDLGDILENGSRVDVIMKLDNKYKENLYWMPGDIYVTGSHMILYKNKFIEVKNHPDAKMQTEIYSDWFSCLITDDHKIKIGEYTFWDWEDDELK